MTPKMTPLRLLKLNTAKEIIIPIIMQNPRLILKNNEKMLKIIRPNIAQIINIELSRQNVSPKMIKYSPIIISITAVLCFGTPNWFHQGLNFPLEHPK